MGGATRARRGAGRRRSRSGAAQPRASVARWAGHRPGRPGGHCAARAGWPAGRRGRSRRGGGHGKSFPVGERLFTAQVLYRYSNPGSVPVKSNFCHLCPQARMAAVTPTPPLQQPPVSAGCLAFGPPSCAGAAGSTPAAGRCRWPTCAARSSCSTSGRSAASTACTSWTSCAPWRRATPTSWSPSGCTRRSSSTRPTRPRSPRPSSATRSTTRSSTTPTSSPGRPTPPGPGRRSSWSTRRGTSSPSSPARATATRWTGWWPTWSPSTRPRAPCTAATARTSRRRRPTTDLRFPGKAVRLPGGTLLVSDSGHHSLVELAEDAETVLRRIGSGDRGLTDGDASTARFAEPQGLCLLPPEVATRRRLRRRRRRHRQPRPARRPARHRRGHHRRRHRPRSGCRATRSRSRATRGPRCRRRGTSPGHRCCARSSSRWPASTSSGASTRSPPSISVWAGTSNEGLVDGPLETAWFAQPSGPRRRRPAAVAGRLRDLVAAGRRGRRRHDRGRTRASSTSGTSTVPPTDALLQHPLGVTVAARRLGRGERHLQRRRTPLRPGHRRGLHPARRAGRAERRPGRRRAPARRGVGRPPADPAPAARRRPWWSTASRSAPTGPVTEVAPGEVDLEVVFTPPPGQKLDDRYGPATRLVVSATPARPAQGGRRHGHRPDPAAHAGRPRRRRRAARRGPRGVLRPARRGRAGRVPGLPRAPAGLGRAGARRRGRTADPRAAPRRLIRPPSRSVTGPCHAGRHVRDRDELGWLDDLLTTSLRGSSEHLRSIVTEGERTLDAAQTCRGPDRDAHAGGVHRHRVRRAAGQRRGRPLPARPMGLHDLGRPRSRRGTCGPGRRCRRPTSSATTSASSATGGPSSSTRPRTRTSRRSRSTWSGTTARARAAGARTSSTCGCSRTGWCPTRSRRTACSPTSD